jgi:hypothetical protein
VTQRRFDPEKILELLVKHRVRFVLVGGVAATLHGSPVLTADVDVAYERTKTNLRRLASALDEVHARLRGIEEDLPFRADAQTLDAGSNFTFVTDIGNLDCLGWVEGIASFAQLSEHAATMRLGRHTVLVASIDDLIAMKRAAGRGKDREAVAYLEALKEGEKL